MQFLKTKSVLLKQLATKTDYLIINAWSLPENERGKYLNDYTDDLGLSKNIIKTKKNLSAYIGWKYYKEILFILYK